MAACVFCGTEGKLTKEHVWPQWVAPYLGEANESGTSTRTIIRSTGTETASRPGKPADLTVKAVCEDCNTGWMHRIEEQARPLVLPLIQGKARLLSRSSCEVVASWAVKTALAAGSRFDPPAPDVFYRDLRDQLRPSDKSRVWLGKVPYLQTHYIDWRPAKFYDAEDGPPERENGFAAVLSCGHLAMYVVGWLDNKPPFPKVFEQFAGSLVRIWPLPGEPAVPWPPSVTIGFDEGLDALADALGAVP